MKHTKQLLALLLALVMTLSLFVGCAAEETDTSVSSVPATTTEAAETREITDMAGRTLTIPAEIDSVFSTGPVAAIFLYMVAPEKLLGWNYELNNIEKSIILEEYHDLPNFGMGDAISYEAVIAAEPTIALCCGSIDESLVESCETFTEKLGIPVVAVDSDLANSAEAFRFLGELLGEEDQGEVLAAYAERIYADLEVLADIPAEERLRVYYGNGEDSLETAPTGSSHADVLEQVSAINVADLELGDGSRVQISAEQLLAWDPDVIVVVGEAKKEVSGADAAASILNDPTYATLKAVQEGQVYGIPNAPFSWVDRPVGPNRLIGLRWLSVLLYPGELDTDLESEVRDFFEYFYHVELTDEGLAALLG